MLLFFLPIFRNMRAEYALGFSRDLLEQQLRCSWISFVFERGSTCLLLEESISVLFLCRKSLHPPYFFVLFVVLGVVAVRRESVSHAHACLTFYLFLYFFSRPPSLPWHSCVVIATLGSLFLFCFVVRCYGYYYTAPLPLLPLPPGPSWYLASPRRSCRVGLLPFAAHSVRPTLCQNSLFFFFFFFFWCSCVCFYCCPESRRLAFRHIASFRFYLFRVCRGDRNSFPFPWLQKFKFFIKKKKKTFITLFWAMWSFLFFR